jgi:hypothetical protein
LRKEHLRVKSCGLTFPFSTAYRAS